MKINLKHGVDKLIFGMKQADVVSLYGEPNRKFKDEEGNVIYLYNKYKIRLTFYEDEDLKLGYIISSNPELEIFSYKIIGKPWEVVEKQMNDKGIISFEKELFDSVDNYFNESNWIIFQTEYSEVIKVEVGATINNKDEFDWKFKK